MKKSFAPILAALVVVLSLAGLVNMNSAGAQSAQNGDYDADDDGLIEVSYLEQLNAIRWDLDGNGDPDRSDNAGAYTAAFPGADPGMGCPNTRCTGYELTRDLDFDSSDSYASGAIDTRWTDGVGWLPIGFVENYFRATFDGNYHTIANLFIKRSGRDDPGVVGLFGTNGDGGTIRHVGLVDVNVTGVDQVGGLVGSSSGIVSDSYATGAISGSDMVGGLVGLVGYNTGGITWSGGTIRKSYTTSAVSGNDQVGGLVGYMYGTINDSYATGNVSGNNNIGGLAGHSVGTGEVINSYAIGNVSGNYWVGGLIGFNEVSTSVSYSTGTVSGSNQVGGLIGRNGGTISASYATSNVSGGEQVGGLIGHNGDSSTVITSYAVGSVSGAGQVGGLVGHSANTAETIGSYWNTQTSGLFSGVGEGPAQGAYGKTTLELQQPTDYSGIYINWLTDIDNSDGDFDSTSGIDDFWDFGSPDQYPALKVDFNDDGTKSWEEFGSQRGDTSAQPTTTATPTPATTPSPTPVPGADLELKMLASDFAHGDGLFYFLTITNNGPADASGVTLIDNLPRGATHVLTMPFFGFCLGSWPIACDLGNLSSGSSSVVMILITADTTLTGILVNTATVASGTADPDPTNNTATYKKSLTP